MTKEEVMTISAFFSEGGEALLARVTAFVSEEIVLDMRIPHQQQTNWCWAAVAVGIKDAYRDGPLKQCALATSIFGQQCCDPGINPSCDVPHTLEEPLGRNFVSVSDDPSVRTRDFIRRNIKQDGRPVAVRLGATNGGAGHFVAIVGYRSIGSEFFVHIDDPHFGPSEHPIEEFLDNHQQTLSWDRSYRTKGFTRPRVPRKGAVQ
jgi:Papain-like cysteine protease AvrRpt2